MTVDRSILKNNTQVRGNNKETEQKKHREKRLVAQHAASCKPLNILRKQSILAQYMWTWPCVYVEAQVRDSAETSDVNAAL